MGNTSLAVLVEKNQGRQVRGGTVVKIRSKMVSSRNMRHNYTGLVVSGRSRPSDTHLNHDCVTPRPASRPTSVDISHSLLTERVGTAPMRASRTKSLNVPIDGVDPSSFGVLRHYMARVYTPSEKMFLGGNAPVYT